jgi:hypothetical protein
MEEELKKLAEQFMERENTRPIPKFEGYSPIEMNYILYITFHEKSPIQFQELTEQEYQKISILQQIKYLADLILKSGELKLTKKGFLSTKTVADIYSQGFIKDKDVENGITKLYKETDAICINLTRILPEIAGLTKKRKGKLSLTKKGEKTFQDNFQLLKEIFKAFATRFNWAYYDGYGQNNIGQIGFGFSLILLSKYGQQKRPDDFYADKYFKAYPNLIADDDSNRCYSLRTFNRFLDYFGLIDIENEGEFPNKKKYIIKTPIYDKLIKCTPHDSNE